MCAERVPVDDWHSNVTYDVICEVSLQQLCTTRMPLVSSLPHFSWRIFTASAYTLQG